ncbi:hypothetical protein DD592_27095 [Enterobacter cloacae complex sp. 2DZ2F20B]|nr:hypothetical protein DD592_27095 [Enterobacter cloacae complex sp. 2DZ2F20B]
MEVIAEKGKEYKQKKQVMSTWSLRMVKTQGLQMVTTCTNVNQLRSLNLVPEDLQEQVDLQKVLLLPSTIC